MSVFIISRVNAKTNQEVKTRPNYGVNCPSVNSHGGIHRSVSCPGVKYPSVTLLGCSSRVLTAGCGPSYCGLSWCGLSWCKLSGVVCLGVLCPGVVYHRVSYRGVNYYSTIYSTVIYPDVIHHRENNHR